MNGMGEDHKSYEITLNLEEKMMVKLISHKLVFYLESSL